MIKSFKALGGLIEFSLRTEIEDLSEEDLKELDDAMSQIKDEIEKKKAKKEEDKKEKENNGELSNDDIPYEVRMKHIINAYRKDQEKWGKLEVYAKHLENEVIRLKSILIQNGYPDSGSGFDYKPSKEISDLKLKIKNLQEEVKQKWVRKKEISWLKNLIEKEYPLRIHKTKELKSIIKSQKAYIKELQDLLEDNDIIYYPKDPVNELETKDIDKEVNDKAVRSITDLFVPKSELIITEDQDIVQTSPKAD